MSYTPTQWKAGDTVTSAKLNKMEQGIAGGANILITHATKTITPIITRFILDKTAGEILDAYFTIIVGEGQNDSVFYKNFMYINSIVFNSETGEYRFEVVGNGGIIQSFSAMTEDDYPVMTSSSNITPVTPSDDSGNTPITYS